MWYFLLPFLVYGAYKGVKIDGSLLVTIIIVFLFVTVAFISPDLRYKLQFYGLALAQAGYGASLLRGKALSVLLSVGLVGFLLGGLYVVMKL